MNQVDKALKTEQESMLSLNGVIHLQQQQQPIAKVPIKLAKTNKAVIFKTIKMLQLIITRKHSCPDACPAVAFSGSACGDKIRCLTLSCGAELS